MPGKNELALIEWFRQRAATSPAALIAGIGDDAAVWQAGSRPLLFTTDMLMDGVDFRVAEIAARDIGRKAMGVNLSDIAAMAGTPQAALLSVALPKSLGFEFACELLEGSRLLAEEFDVAIIGGDTNTWDGPLVISVTLIGEAAAQGAVLRNTAQAGDWLFVTGSLGGSLLGHHVHFTPRVREARSLHERYGIAAMIDLSDGLAADLHHLLDESGVGATLWETAIPISDAARQMSDKQSPLSHALNDGEDFELLFSVRPDVGRRLLAEERSIPLSHIGEVVRQRSAVLIASDGSSRELLRSGWEHTF